MGYAKQETNDAQSELDLSNMSEHLINAMSDCDNIPIGNIAAWSKLQSEDDSIKKAIAYRKSGQNPPKSDKFLDMKEIRFYVSKCKYDSSNNVLVKEEAVPFQPEMRKKIVVPVWFLKHLLVQIHYYLNCPEPSQMKKIFDR